MARYSLPWFFIQFFVYLDWIYFFHNFLDDKDKKDFILTSISVLIYYLLCVLIVKLISNDFISSMFTWLAMFISLYLVRRPNVKKLLIAIVIFLALGVICETLSMLIYFGLEYLFKIDDYMIMFIYAEVCFLVFYIAIKFYKKDEFNINTNISFVIILLALNQEIWLYYLSNIITDSETSNLSFSIAVILLQLLVIGIVSYLTKDYVHYKKIKMEEEIKERNKEELKNQINSLGDKQSILNKIYKQIGDEDLSIDKLDELSKDLKDIRMTIYSDNPSINALLSYFNSECLKENISFNVEVKGSIKDKLNDYDLNILITNILKNALEASNENIDLKIVSTDSNLIIRCSNTKDNKEKKNKLINGQGTVIIKDIVSKYNGIYNFEIKDKIANTEVLLAN